MVSVGFRNLAVDQAGSRLSNSDHDLFLTHVSLLEVLWSFFLVQPPSWSLPIVIKSTFRCMSQSDQEMVHCCVEWREDDTSKRRFFWFSVSSWGTHLRSFFTFPICFKCRMTTEWLMLSSLATPQLWWLLSVVIVYLQWPGTPPLWARLSFANILEPSVQWTLVSGPWAKWSPLLYDPFWTWIKNCSNLLFVKHHFYSLK